MRCTEAIEAGAYVLGALPPAERSAYERHIASCTSCREEVAQLAGLPGLLGRLDSSTAGSIGKSETAPPALLETMLIRTRAERIRGRRQRRWRRAGALLIAACLVVLVAFGATTLARPTVPAPVVVILTPVDEDTPVSAMVGYWAASQGGSDITMVCVYGTGNPHYTGRAKLDLWIFPRGAGAGRSVWSWEAGPGERLTFWTESPLRPDQIGRMEVRHGDTTLLVYTA